MNSSYSSRWVNGKQEYQCKDCSVWGSFGVWRTVNGITIYSCIECRNKDQAKPEPKALTSEASASHQATLDLSERELFILEALTKEFQPLGGRTLYIHTREELMGQVDVKEYFDLRRKVVELAIRFRTLGD